MSFVKAVNGQPVWSAWQSATIDVDRWCANHVRQRMFSLDAALCQWTHLTMISGQTLKTDWEIVQKGHA